MRVLSLCASAVLVLSTACATGSRPADDLHPEGRRCHAIGEPGRFPGPADLGGVSIRSGIALLGWQMTPADSVEIAVRYDETGGLAWTLPIRGTVSRERAERLADLVLRSAAPEVDGEWGYRLLVVGGDVAAVRPSVICEGEVQGVRKQHAFSDISDPGTEPRRRGIGELVPVHFDVDARGLIRGVELQASRPTIGEEIYVLLLAERGRVLPKLHDGVPVASVVREMVEIPRSR